MKGWLAGVALVVGTASTQGPAGPAMLVTPEEAARPDLTPPPLRGLFPGPAIRLALPTKAALRRPLTSPFHLKIAFTPRNQSTIDRADVKLIYVKAPAADLTSRVLPGISNSGIDLAAMNLPPGHHTLLVTVADSRGERSAATYTLTVIR